MPIKSLLKQTIKNLPEGSTMKAEAVKPMLLKKGVKQEELDFSGIELPGKGRVSREELLGLEKERKDMFYTTEVDPHYKSISLPGGQANPTYREKVLRFEQVDQAGSRYTSTHFPETENYLAHTRIYDEDFNGTPTRVLQEIQSDLHQQGRQRGYATGDSPSFTALQQQMLDRPDITQSALDDEDFAEEVFGVSLDELQEAYRQLATRTTLEPNDLASLSEEEILHEVAEAGKNVIPKSPFEKNWLAKSIEREVSDAIDEGRAQLAIPIKGAVKNLKRAEGVQKWYETQVVNTAKKVARKAGMEFELVSKDGGSEILSYDDAMNYIRNASDKIAYAQNEDDAIAATASDLVRLGLSEDRAKVIAENIADPFTEYSEIAEQLSTMQEDVVYAVIKPGALKEVISADEVIKDAKDFSMLGPTAPEYAKKEAELVAKYKDRFPQGVAEGGALADELYDIAMGKSPKSLTKHKADVPDFALYSTPTAGAFAAYAAYKNGYSEDDVTKYLTEQGYDAEDIAEINANAEKIAQAEAAGYSREEIEQFLQGKEITTKVEANEPTLQAQGKGDPRTDSPGLGVPRRLYADVKQEAMDRLQGDEEMSASEIVRNLQTVQPVMTSDIMTSIPAFFGNKEALTRYNAAREASRSKIIDIAKRDYGIDLVWQAGDVGQEGWYVNTEQGMVEVTPSFWQDLKSTTGETIGGITGAIAGFKYAPPNPVAKAAGAAIGGMAGAMAGAQLDYLQSAVEMQVDMEAEVAAHKALNAAELAIVGEVIGYPVAKSLGAGWRGVVRAKNMIFDGNPHGAYKALKDTMFMNDAEIEEIVQKFEKLAGPLDGSKEQKAIAAVALSERGMQDLVRVAGSIDPKASQAVIKSVDDRAADLLKTTADLSNPEITRTYTKDLQNYVSDVKGFYDAVKAKAVQSPRGLNFDWDYDKLAIEPVLERLSTKITDPATSEKFLLQAQRIRSFSESRNFGDLIEFRQIVNDFLYNKRIVKSDDKKMLRGIINNIDAAIKEGAPQVVENPEAWLNNWATARLKYTEMKKVEQTAMYRMVFDKKGNVRPVQPETVVKGLTKYMGALDGSFEEVMSKLPEKARGKYEGAVVNHLAEKYTAGVKGGMRAVNFPLLADELAKVNFTAPNARMMKKAITEMADVFKNDVYLAQASGKIEIPKFQSYLTTDPVVRAKFEIASGIFNTLKTWAPGDTQRNYALVKQAAQLLEQPLHAKSSRELMKQFEGDVVMTDSIKQLQREAAKAKAAGKDLGAAKVLVDANGKFVKSVEQAAHKIPQHRVASEETVKLIADRESITVDNKSLDKVLKQYGYVAVAQGSDRIRMLGGK